MRIGGLDRGFGRLTRLDGCRVDGRLRIAILAPQLDTAGQPVGVRHYRNIRLQRKGDVLGVAAADIEVIETDDLPKDLDHFRHSLIPSLLALLLPSGVPDIFVVGLAPAHRVMPALEMRHDLAVAEERGAGAGAERQHHFQPVPLDRAKTLNVGVVEDTYRLSP